MVSHAIGSVIGSSTSAEAREFTIPDDVSLFKIALRRQLKQDVEELNCELTHLFGAWVIQGDAIPVLDIGPVQFSLRAHWVQDSVAADILTADQASALFHYWENGGPTRSFTEDIDWININEIIEALGPCPWVCAVRVRGHAQARSRERALYAARIALAAISLAWNPASKSAKETGLIYDIGKRRIRNSVIFKNGSFAGSWSESVLRRGHFLSTGDANAFVTETGRRVKPVGAALNTFLSVNTTSQKRSLEEALCQALIWFGEACNEPLEFMAIVKFAAALDTLAKGKQLQGICKLVKQRCCVEDMNAPFLQDGTSAKQLVKQIYTTGRSRIVHGASPDLIYDLDKLRVRSELLATIVLRACIHWLDTYDGNDDVAAFAT